MTKKFEYTDTDGRIKEAEAYILDDYASTGGTPLTPIRTNADGFIDENLFAPSTADSSFFSVSNVAVGGTQQVFSKAGFDGLIIEGIEVSGNNKGVFKLYLDAVQIAIKRINYLDFGGVIDLGGLRVETDSILVLTVENASIHVGDFEARIITRG